MIRLRLTGYEAYGNGTTAIPGFNDADGDERTYDWSKRGDLTGLTIDTGTPSPLLHTASWDFT
ncbi:MAG: hypothetical protein ACWA5L_02610 [bacterium]